MALCKMSLWLYGSTKNDPHASLYCIRIHISQHKQILNLIWNNMATKTEHLNKLKIKVCEKHMDGLIRSLRDIAIKQPEKMQM
jgi:hypothetical protein